MSKRCWTEAQTEAIEARDPQILVSAAAGSGKTAVLTERIIRRITDRENPVELSRLLVVTYTRTAAAEMRERIADALRKAMAAEPGNSYLSRQYALLSKASISTIDSFYLTVIRQNFEALNLTPNLSVLDPVQSSLLKKQVLNAVLDGYYAGLPGYTDIDDFIGFADNFITDQDDVLADIFLNAYQKLCTFPQGLTFLLEAAEDYGTSADTSFFASRVGREILRDFIDTLRDQVVIHREACRYYETVELFAKNYYPAFYNDISFMESLISAYESGDRNRLASILSQDTKQIFVSLGSGVRAENKTERSEQYIKIRNSIKEFIKSFKDSYVSLPDKSIDDISIRSRDLLNKLYVFLSTFERRYEYEKSIRNVVDFEDLPRMTHRLLVGENKTPTETAVRLSRQYDEIYIDEYQDVNEIQDDIFSVLSRTASRFMVGDIKQSIFAFRNAEPSLFASYREDPSVRKVFLQHNFRCDQPVIDYVNAVCGRLFPAVGRTVPYEKKDELICGKTGGGNAPVEVVILDKPGLNAENGRKEEASYIADRISDLIAKENRRPGDFCLLFRSTKQMPLYENALRERGLPCRSKEKRSLFSSPEILLAVNILNVIDNPRRDVPLAGALKSPVFNVTLDELVAIRKHRKAGSLFEALRSYTEETGFSKGGYFLGKLAEFRALSTEPCDRLLMKVFQETSFFALVSEDPSGESRSDLLKLYDFARRFESKGYQGLHAFIRYLNGLMKNNKSDDSISASDAGDNAVHLMSIHGAKGLEYPIVFLCDSARSLIASEMGPSPAIRIDKHFGAILKLADESGLATLKSPFQTAIKEIEKNLSLDEEARILYVAMTRAVSRLIITGYLDKAQKAVSELAQRVERFPISSPYPYRISPTYLSWLVLSFPAQPNIRYLSDRVEPEALTTDQTTDRDPESEAFPEEEIAALADTFRKRFTFSYPGAEASALPAKLSVSELYPTILDDYSDALLLSDTRQSRMKTPRFLSEQKASGADRGTATHLFMQFCDFARLESVSVEAEIERLTNERFLDDHTASLISVPALKLFLKSDLFPHLCRARDLKRELRFTVRLPAPAFTASQEAKKALSEETILVQGILDAVFTDENGQLTLLDYKTDQIPDSVRSITGASEKMLIERYRDQLSYYRAACRVIFCRELDRVMLYSFALGRAFPVPFTELLSV